MDRIVGGKYKLGRKIGSGSFGEIHLGFGFHLFTLFQFYQSFIIFEIQLLLLQLLMLIPLKSSPLKS